MSGSGGGGSGDNINTTPCELLRFEALLTSPKSSVVSTISDDDILDITVVSMNNQLVVQVLKNGQVAGGLTGPDAARLRDCMGQGHQYRATVRSINGGQVRVFVEHV